MRQVAAETKTPLLDIFEASQRLYRSMGEKESQQLFMHLPEKAHPNYPAGVTDNPHFSDKGAKLVPKLIAEAIRQCTELSALKQRTVEKNLDSDERLAHQLVN
ncbi:hypothetical protein [Paenibacillus polymyxa]|uniref:hypothetical protein n=1 Tax=Paenibacillus polymyxa TaxID=1406 RepID=UPI00287F93B6|nr:hypothetical protein [Paenibacillus polymyxa]